MRRKTEAKRQEILTGAARAFEKNGYKGMTLDLIAKEIGCSKVTIYNYFESREELLKAILLEGYKPALAYLATHLSTDATIGERLKDFANTYIMLITNQYSIWMLRLMAAEGDSLGFSDVFTDGGPFDVWQTVYATIERAVEDGALPDGDAMGLTSRLRALLHGGSHYRHLVFAAALPSPEQLAQEANEAVDTILAPFTD